MEKNIDLYACAHKIRSLLAKQEYRRNYQPYKNEEEYNKEMDELVYFLKTTLMDAIKQ